MSHFNGGNWMACLHVNALGIFLNLCGTSCKKDWWIIIHIRCKCFVLFSLIHVLYRKHTFFKRRSSIHEKHPISIFSTLYLLSTGHTNLWHQKALARHSWRLTIWTVGQQKTLISSFTHFYGNLRQLWYKTNQWVLTSKQLNLHHSILFPKVENISWKTRKCPLGFCQAQLQL